MQAPVKKLKSTDNYDVEDQVKYFLNYGHRHISDMLGYVYTNLNFLLLALFTKPALTEYTNLATRSMLPDAFLLAHLGMFSAPSNQ